jgi:hypothetical protein
MKCEELVQKYPEAFKSSIDPLYPFPMFGFECGDGWAALLEPPIKYIHEYNVEKPEEDRISISQIKEKFGTLRFYIHGHDDTLDKLINEAENKSEITCENCGEEGKLRGRGWYYTACDTHTREEDKV